MAPNAIIIAFTEHGDLVRHIRTRTGERTLAQYAIKRLAVNAS